MQVYRIFFGIKVFFKGLRTPTQTEHVAMNTTANLTSVVLEEPQEGPENEMTFVFLGVVATTMILFLVGTLWARRKDHKEKEMCGVTVIPQRSVHRCPQYYLLMFYTGAGRHSGTSANVFCRIYGNHHKTKPIILRDPDRPMFEASSISSFLVTLNCSLDQIREIHVWHDISGPGPPWFLESVIICHLNTNVTWYFEAHRWLDVSTGSKEVECKLKPLPRKILLGVKTMIDGKIDDNLRNKHLWFSTLYKTNRKTFSKFQKMSCCVSVTGTIILIATVLVHTTQTLFSDSLIRLGPWKVNLGDIHRALVCSGIAFVYRLLLELLFFNSQQNTTMGADDKNVQGYIQHRLEELNAMIFLDETIAIGDDECADFSSNAENENSSSSHHSTCGIQLEFTNSQELQNETEAAHNDQLDKIRHAGVSLLDKQPMEGDHDNCSLNKAQTLEELIDILGNLPEKKDIIQVLDENSHVFHGRLNGELPANHDCLEGLEEGRLSSVAEELKTSSNCDALPGQESKEDRPKSVTWTTTLTNPDKIPQIWKSLPFPKHLIDDDSIRKPTANRSPKLNRIFLNITQVHCFILPFISTVVAVAIGMNWSTPLTKSWLMTFGIAIICQIFVVESLYVVLHAIYFSMWCQRPVKEEDMIDELSSKVWNNEEEKTTYYADEIDEDEGEPVPRPPTQEDIQKAQEEAGKDRELEDVLKMLCFNVLFLTLLIFVSFGNRDSYSYPIRAGLENSFNVTKSFTIRVKNPETFWKWLINDTVPVLLYEPLGRTARKGRRHFLADGCSYLLGTAILRQQRIKPGASCQIADAAENLFPECTPVFLTEHNEDTDYYHQEWKKGTTSLLNHTFNSPWKYLSGEESKTDYTSWGRSGRSFGGGGYIAHLGTDQKIALDLVNSLKAHHWVDDLTRVVFLELSVYNANVNIITAMIFSIEFSSFGGASPRFDMYSFRLYRYFTPLQFIYLVGEIIFVVFVVQLIYRVGCLIYRDRCGYFMSIWNFTDLFLILFSLVTIALYVLRSSHLNSAIEAIQDNPDTFYGFLTVAFYDDYIAYFSCLIVLIPTIQFLKFLKFNKNFMIFYHTLDRIRGDISGFAFVFFVSMMCFTYWAYSMLKTTAESFSTFGGTFNSMIAMLLGKFSFRLLSPGRALTATVGPIFTYAFTCANVFLILNIILTIITIGFTEAREDERFQQSEYEIISFITNYVKGLCGLLPPYIPPPPQIEPPPKEKHFTYFQWKLCTSYVTRSQCPRLLNFANKTYLEDFVDELELVANLLSIPQSRRLLYEITLREQGF